MSLVAYDSSDESEEEISQNHNSPIAPKKLTSFASKRQRESVKITIPSLKEFEEEENENITEKKPKLQTGFGLFSLLPPPKNASTLSKPGFVPHILKSKKEQISSKKHHNTAAKDIKGAVTKNIAIFNAVSSVTIKQDSDDDDIPCEFRKSSQENITPTTDFFSLDNPKDKISDKSYASTDTSPASSKINTFIHNQSDLIPSDTYFQQSSIENVQQSTSYSQDQQHEGNANHEEGYSSEQLDYSSEYYDGCATETVPKESLLNDEAFRKFQGRRREFEAVDIIEVNAADQLSDTKEWLMKSLTEESTHRPARKKHNMPTSQQKRKHQITYLAFQAKEREMDLKNQWSLNSRTRRETQAKYGF